MTKKLACKKAQQHQTGFITTVCRVFKGEKKITNFYIKR